MTIRNENLLVAVTLIAVVLFLGWQIAGC